jgi:hypothetical protein
MEGKITKTYICSEPPMFFGQGLRSLGNEIPAGKGQI